MIKFSFSIEHVQYVHHTMIEASADLSGTELELSDVTSPLLASRVITSEEEQGSSRKKKIKPTKSINDLLKFESESGSEEEEEVFPPDSDPDLQPEQVVYTPNLEMLHSSLEKEMDCGGGSQLGGDRAHQVGERCFGNDNGMLGQLLQTGTRKGVYRDPSLRRFS